MKMVVIYFLRVLILGLKFYKNLGFSLSEHCEWGTCSIVFYDVAQGRTVGLIMTTLGIFILSKNNLINTF
jgi:hypothetical protein